jgi:hypothetical protein
MSLGPAASRKLLLAGLLGALAAGCGKAPVKQEPEKVDPALQANVLDAVPSDIQHRLFIDFGGKVHLLGYNIEPKGVVAPGHKVKLTMFWQPISRLGPGWKLFTHILDASGRLVANDDNDGPLRTLHDNHQALPPSKWQRGKVYVDEQEIEVPAKIESPEIIVTVGIWRGSTRLDVLSGLSDGKHRGIIAHIKTGLLPPKPASKKPPKKS